MLGFAYWKSSFRRGLVNSRRLALLGLCALGGCVPLTPPPPFHFVETAQALPKGQVSVTVAGGGGAGAFDAAAGGGAARVRVGVGAGNEIGIEGTAALVSNQKQDQDHSEPWFGRSGAYGYKLSWKYSPLPWFAVEAGVGGSVSTTGDGLGGDLALLFSRSRGVVRPYVGTRATIGVPVGRPANDAGGVTPMLVQAGGLAIVPVENLRLYAELGLMISASQVPDPDPNSHQDWSNHFDGYGGIGIEVRFGRHR